MLQAIGNQMGLAQAPSQPLGLQNLFEGGIKCTQNERRLQEEKAQRNLLKKYLTQATGDPIQSALISSTIPGKGFGDTFDVGLGTKRSIMQSLGTSQLPKLGTKRSIMQSLGTSQLPNTNLLSSLGGMSQIPATNPGLLQNVGNAVSMANTVNQGAGLMNTLGGNTSTLGAIGNIANLGKSTTANTGLLNSLVSLASTPNNNGNILGSLGGLGTGLLGNSGNTGGVLGNIQSGINTLNTINKVNNAVSGIQGVLS